MKLQRDFYERDALIVSRELLGKYLVHRTDEGATIGKIVEVEAYIGPDDAAAHMYKGLRTNRTEVIFGAGGFSYVYLIYGMYYCFNIVSNVAEKPEAILIRALEPIDGLELMKARRKTDKVKNLCSGPGKLCGAMDITKKQNSMDLCGDELYLTEGESIKDTDISTTPRINIDYAGEAIHYPWRFILHDNKFLSKK